MSPSPYRKIFNITIQCHQHAFPRNLNLDSNFLKDGIQNNKRLLVHAYVLRIRIGCDVAVLLAEWIIHPRAHPIKYTTMVVVYSVIFNHRQKGVRRENNFFAANTDFSPN